jgi:hypothetical protein
MASEKAIYWLALGVLALGLNGTYQQGEARWVNRLAERSVQIAEHTAQRGLNLVSMLDVMLGRDPSDVARLQAALAQLEARQAESSAMAQAEIAGAQRQLGRMNFEMRRMRMTAPRFQCPEEKIKMKVRESLSRMTVPAMVDETLVVNGRAIDFNDVNSLQSLQSMESLKALESMQSAQSFQSFNFDHNFRFAYPDTSAPEVHVKIHKSESDGTI